MLDQLLAGSKNDIVAKLVKTLGVDAGKAGGFFQQALSMIQGLLTSGKLDPTALLSGNLGSIGKMLNLGDLSKAAGTTPQKAEAGVGVITGALGEHAGELEKLVGGGGGLGGVLKDVAGKIFG